MKARFIGILLAATVTIAGCGGGSSSAPTSPPPGNQPGAQPSASPSPSASPAWTSLTYEVTCSPPDAMPSCAESPFTVTRQGRYDVAQGRDGDLTVEQTQALQKAADPIVNDALSTSEPSCDSDTVSIPEVSRQRLTVTTTQGTNIAILDQASGGKRCVRGNPATVEALNELMNRLAGQLSVPQP